jgi:hypothetical protein
MSNEPYDSDDRGAGRVTAVDLAMDLAQQIDDWLAGDGRYCGPSGCSFFEELSSSLLHAAYDGGELQQEERALRSALAEAFGPLDETVRRLTQKIGAKR